MTEQRYIRSRLLCKAPNTVVIDGIDYEINTRYRDCLLTIISLSDPEFTPEERVEILINNMYLDDPPNLAEAAEKALWFLRCGEEYRKRNQPILCDFAQDGKYIHDAFLKCGIDLDDPGHDNMHWWTFMSRFAELPESFFSRLLYLRSQHRKGKLTKEEKAEIARIGEDVVYIKNPESLNGYIENSAPQNW